MTKQFKDINNLQEWARNNKHTSMLITHISSQLVIAIVETRSYIKDLVPKFSELLEDSKPKYKTLDCVDYINNNSISNTDNIYYIDGIYYDDYFYNNYYNK